MNLTPVPYSANIGPGGPDLNRATRFSRVHTAMKEKQSPFFTQTGAAGGQINGGPNASGVPAGGVAVNGAQGLKPQMPGAQSGGVAPIITQTRSMVQRNARL